MTAALNADLMWAMVPHLIGPKGDGQRAIISQIGPILTDTLVPYEIDKPLRAAHFLAQCAQESDSFCTTVEYASGAAYEYRRDLGNIYPGDGPRYKGRGLIQLTGRRNYQIYGEKLGQPLEVHPEIAAQPVLSLSVACEYWKLNNINALADRDDVAAVTRAVNGGYLGLAQRAAFLGAAKQYLGLTEMAGGEPILRKGAHGPAVAEAQQLLHINADSWFGDDTERAVMVFQAAHHLEPDGVIGPVTWKALRG